MPDTDAPDATCEEIIEVDYDQELSLQQTVCDEKQMRLAHEAQKGREVRKEMNKALDELIETAQRKTAG